MVQFLWGLLKDIAFWTLTPLILIALGVGIGWLGGALSSPVLGVVAIIFIGVGVVWLALLWLGVAD